MKSLILPFTPEEQADLRAAVLAAQRAMSDATMLAPLSRENLRMPEHRRALMRFYWRLSQQEELEAALGAFPWWARWVRGLPGYRRATLRRLARRFIRVAGLLGLEDE